MAFLCGLVLALHALAFAPSAHAQDYATIYDALRASSYLSELLKAVDASASFKALMQDPNTAIRLLAPENQGFADVSTDWAGLDQTKRDQVLSYHAVSLQALQPVVAGNQTLHTSALTVGGVVQNVTAAFHFYEGKIQFFGVPKSGKLSLDPSGAEVSRYTEFRAGQSTITPVRDVLMPNVDGLRPAGAYSTVADAAVAAGLTTLVQLTDLVGMTSLLANPDLTVTVFAPTNEAFQRALTRLNMTQQELASKPALVTRILQNHIVRDGPIMMNETPRGKRVVPTLSSDVRDALQMTYSTSRKHTYQVTSVLGDTPTALATTPDVVSGKSVVHVIDQVLLPDLGPATVYDALGANPQLSTLKSLVDLWPQANLTKDPSFVATLLAPTNAAFAKLSTQLNIADLVAYMAGKPDLLDTVLRYHVVDVGKPPLTSESGVPNLVSMLTFEGDRKYNVSRALLPTDVNGVRVQLHGGQFPGAERVANSSAGLSKLVTLSAVLVPPTGLAPAAPHKTLAAAVQARSDLSELWALLSEDTRLRDEVESPDFYCALFAPTNDAIRALRASGVRLDPGTASTKEILRYNIADLPYSTSSLLLARQRVVVLTGNFIAVANAGTTEAPIVTLQGGLNTEVATITSGDIIAAKSVIHITNRVLLPSAETKPPPSTTYRPPPSPRDTGAAATSASRLAMAAGAAAALLAMLLVV